MEDQKVEGVVVMVLRHTHEQTQLLFLRRSGGPFKGEWWPVAGHCESQENPTITALRELKEETNLEALEIHSLDREIPHIDGTTKLQGFAVLVDEKSEVQLNYEHSEFKWLTFIETYDFLPRAIHPFISYIEGRFCQ